MELWFAYLLISMVWTCLPWSISTTNINDTELGGDVQKHTIIQYFQHIAKTDMNKLNTIGNRKMEDNEEISFEHHLCSYCNLSLSCVWLLISQTYLIVHLCNLIPKNSHVQKQAHKIPSNLTFDSHKAVCLSPTRYWSFHNSQHIPMKVC